MKSDRLTVRCVLERPDFDLNIELDLPMRGVTGIFGVSGAGKTTLLRCIAGLERPANAGIVVAGETWHDSANGVCLAAHERQVGYVFQEPRLFSHLDVRANLLYGANRSDAQGNDIDFDGVVELLGLAALLNRRPTGLSGGEAQRVSIGRALLRNPRLVLMDEPLASLDAARKADILPFLDRLHAELAIPILYVSHNIDEVCRLCDNLVVLGAGRVLADGELQSVLVGMDVPQLGGEEAGSIINGEISAYDADYDLTHIRFSGGELRVPGRHGTPNTRLRLRIRASDVSLCRERPRESTILNILHGTIDALEDAAAATCLVRLAVGDERLLARITRRSAHDLGLCPGQSIEVQIKAAAVRGP